jgi:hypothetical protein
MDQRAESIRRRAHEIWVQEGRREGRSEDHWERAARVALSPHLPAGRRLPATVSIAKADRPGCAPETFPEIIGIGVCGDDEFCSLDRTDKSDRASGRRGRKIAQGIAEQLKAPGIMSGQSTIFAL